MFEAMLSVALGTVSVDEWSLSLTAEQHLAPSTIRAYQCSLRMFNAFLCDSRYGRGGSVPAGVRAAGLPDV